MAQKVVFEGRELEIVSRDTEALVPNARNARTHSDGQVDELVNSIKEFGWTNPILIDEKDGIIAGHGRVMAAKKAGLSKCPCIVLTGLTEDQKRAYMIADNQLALKSGWNLEILRVELQDLRTQDFELSVLGFNNSELNNYLKPTEDMEADENKIPEVPTNPVSRVGDLWDLGDHKLICGDSEDEATVQRLFNGVKPNLMVTDPPYGVNYDPSWRNDHNLNSKVGKANRATGVVKNDHKADWQKCYELFPGNIAYVWHGGLHAPTVANGLINAGFELKAQIIWNKQVQVFGRGMYHWKHEPCWVAIRKTGKTDWKGDRKQTTVWDIQNGNPMGGTREGAEAATGHGTQKPVECMRKPIIHHTNEGQCVYDPFMGSGTTIIAAETTGRTCYGVELNPAYIDIAIIRWQTISGKEATLNGKTYEQVKKERLKLTKSKAKVDKEPAAS